MPKAFVCRLSGGVSLAALLAFGLPAAPAMAQGLAVYARTPTGLAETLFDGDPEEAASQLADQCLSGGLSVVTKEAGAVTCQLPDDREAGARADLGQAGRSGRPIFYRFQVEERGTATRVLANGWEEVAGFWGGTKQRDFDDPVFHNALMELMEQAGGRLPPGTRFPNHAMIGASFVARIRPEPSLEVTEIKPDSPALRAGLQPGDLVTRIGNRRTRTLEDLNRSLVEAARAANFEIHFLREGREGVALLRSEFRPAVIAPMLAEAEEPELKDTLAAAAPVETPPAATGAIVAAAAPAASQPMPGVPAPQATPAVAMQAYNGLPYTGMPEMAPQGMPLTYAVPQPYVPAPYAMPQGTILPPAAVAAPASVAPLPAASPPAPAAGFSVADELAKFATLLKDGVITQAEFDAQKARLLTQ